MLPQCLRSKWRNVAWIVIPCGTQTSSKGDARTLHASIGDAAGETQVFLMALIRVWFQSAHVEESKWTAPALNCCIPTREFSLRRGVGNELINGMKNTFRRYVAHLRSGGNWNYHWSPFFYVPSNVDAIDSLDFFFFFFFFLRKPHFSWHVILWFPHHPWLHFGDFPLTWT